MFVRRERYASVFGSFFSWSDACWSLMLAWCERDGGRINALLPQEGQVKVGDREAEAVGPYALAFSSSELHSLFTRRFQPGVHLDDALNTALFAAVSRPDSEQRGGAAGSLSRASRRLMEKAVKDLKDRTFNSSHV